MTWAQAAKRFGCTADVVIASWMRSAQSHVFGWKLVLAVNGLLLRFQVCRSRDEVLDVSEDWRQAMVSAGWQ